MGKNAKKGGNDEPENVDLPQEDELESSLLFGNVTFENIKTWKAKYHKIEIFCMADDPTIGCYIKPISAALLYRLANNLRRLDSSDISHIGRTVFANCFLGGSNCLRDPDNINTMSMYASAIDFASDAVLPHYRTQQAKEVGNWTGDEELVKRFEFLQEMEGKVIALCVGAGDECKYCLLKEPTPNMVSKNLRNTLTDLYLEAGQNVLRECWLEGDESLKTLFTFENIAAAWEAAELVKPLATNRFTM